MATPCEEPCSRRSEEPSDGARFARCAATHPQGGVPHVAFTVPEAEFDHAAAQRASRGYPVVQALTLPVATVAFVDTMTEIGVATEIIGVTEAGQQFIARLQSGAM